MEHVTIDLWAANLEPIVPDLASWLAGLEVRVGQTAASGGHMLVLPEFACAQWLGFAPVDLPAAETMGWLAHCAETALDAIADMSTRHNVSILAGTFPCAAGPADGIETYFNRAWLLTPDGARHAQDKLSLTPLEAHGAGGITVRGDTVHIIPWNGLRIAIVICLDSEFTDLWSRLGNLDLDLILIPAKTDMITGYNRVFGCARARAIELQTVVCVLGAVGVPFGHALTDTGVGGASVFLPCDVSVSLDGIHAALAPQTAAMMTNHVLTAANIPVGACRRLRNGHAEAEVCPAKWDADHVSIDDPAGV
jgi:predicted amidohydrolase